MEGNCCEKSQRGLGVLGVCEQRRCWVAVNPVSLGMEAVITNWSAARF